MKKLFMFACVMAVSAGFAIAQETVSIPFVADATEVEGAFQVSMPASYNGFGSVVMTTNTGTDIVAGRVVTYAPEGAFAHNVNVY